MRSMFSLLASLLVMSMLGCNTVDPDECWVNTSGGFGGGDGDGDGETIPIGAGVGATSSGDFLTPPPGGPLAAEATENPCVAMGSVTVVSFSHLPSGIFCDRFRTGVGLAFKAMYPNLGASVKL